jgi:hypothetical protein
MPWELFKRDDVFQGHEHPFVTVTSQRFHFNAVFARIAQLDAIKNVTFHIDSENRKVGFEFHRESVPESFVLSQKKDKTGFTCSAVGVLRKYAWLRAVAKLRGQTRRFKPRKDGSLWVIQVCPAFEEQRARESDEIPASARGVYRYLRENGEIVYIGRGEIRSRLMLPERKEWDFDRVEYSMVQDPDEQVKWESYWIDRFKHQNVGKLPFYNQVSGACPK